MNNWQQRLVEFDTFERKLKVSGSSVLNAMMWCGVVQLWYEVLYFRQRYRRLWSLCYVRAYCEPYKEWRHITYLEGLLSLVNVTHFTASLLYGLQYAVWVVTKIPHHL